MRKDKKIMWMIIGSGMVGGLLGIMPPAYTNAFILHEDPTEVLSNYTDSTWQDITFYSVVKDTLTLEERIQRIEEMMYVSMVKMTNIHQTSNSSNLYFAQDIRISDEGKNFIKQYESLALDAYRLKGEKRYTIGYGHVIYEEDIPHHINKATAEKIFNSDMERFQSYAKDMLSELDNRFVYSQGFIDGFISLIYNCGPDGVRKTRFWKRMKACRYDKKTKMINHDDLLYAIEAVKTANISKHYKKGHQSRRKKEHHTMTK